MTITRSTGPVDRLRTRADARASLWVAAAIALCVVTDAGRADDVNITTSAIGTGFNLDPLAGILGFETRPLVSADYVNDARSAIVDGPSTMVTDDTLLKVYAWYDNEVGYACRMVDLANIVIERSA